MTDPGEKAKKLMSDIPTPIEGRSKRRGLALPPRGQALARLQDLETNQPTPAAEASDAVRTASSNAVTDTLSTALRTGGSVAGMDSDADVAPAPEAASPHPEMRNVAPHSYRPAARAAREPTTRITVDMPDSLHRQISMLSAETRRSIKELVIEALEATYFGGQADGQ